MHKKFVYAKEDLEKEEIDKDLTIRAYKYGQDFVAITNLDKANLKKRKEKMISVIGFTNRHRVSRLFLTRSPLYGRNGHRPSKCQLRRGSKSFFSNCPVHVSSRQIYDLPVCQPRKQ